MGTAAYDGHPLLNPHITTLDASLTVTKSVTLMRLYGLATFALAAIAAGEMYYAASAASVAVPDNLPLAAPVTATPAPAALQVVPPETLVAQEFSASVPTDSEASRSPQYYQNYRPVAIPAAASPAVPAQTTTQPATTQSAAPAPPSLIAPPVSISEPTWVIPAAAPASSASSAPDSDLPPATPATPTQSDWPMPPTTPTQSGTPAAPAQVVVPTPVTPPPPPISQNPNELVVTATEVQILGVEAELQEVVRRTILTRPGGPTTPSQQQADVKAILDTGFFTSANVSTVPTPIGVAVTYQVQPIVVRSVQVSGAQVLTPAVVNQAFANQVNQAVSPAAITQAVRQINQWYINNGYKLARVLSVEPNAQGTLTLEVAEGNVADVQIRFINAEGKTVDANGNPIQGRTQPGFVRDQIKLQPGQVFQESVVAEDIRRLYGLGIFDRVNVGFEGDARQTVVVYNLVEGKARGFNFGGGYNEDVGIYGTISYNDRNFSGLGQQLGGTVQISGRDVLFEGNFRSPYRASTPETPGYGAFIFRRRGLSRVFDEEIRLDNEDKVRERQFGGGIYAEKPLGPEWMGNLGLNYTRTRMTDEDGDTFKKDAKGNPLSWSGKGYDDLTTISFAATRDRRDNPINPSTGSVLSLSTAQSIPIGTGSILNNTLQANYAQFFPVNWLTTPESRVERGTQQPEVLAFNVQGGTVLGDLPPYNAFTLGGSDSVRGYDPGDVASSRSYFLLSAEYRFPIYKFIGGAVFADFGSDLGSSDNVLGEPGVQRDKPGTGAGFGAGVRVNSPLGILRLDFGVNVEGDTKLQFGLGQKF